MKEIPVRGGLVALVDDEDGELASGYSWTLHRSKCRRAIYAVAYVRGAKPYRNVYLHRLLLGAPSGVQVDHRDGNGLNCQRRNLRVATNTTNHQNVSKCRTYNGIVTTSHYKGVNWDRTNKVWRASSRLNGTYVHLGCFQDEIKAALAYNAFAAEHYGDFARLNDL